MSPRSIVVMPQSEANSADGDAIESLLEGMKRISRLECLFRMSGGYSDSRIYLARAELNGTPAAQPWIVKLGPTHDIEQDYDGLVLARAFVPPAHMASPVECLRGNTLSLLLLDYAAYYGRPPLTLEALIAGVEAEEGIAATAQLVQQWVTKTSTSRTYNVGAWLKEKSATKLTRLPAHLKATSSFKNILSPDFGEVYANPLYYLDRDLKRRDTRAPFSFCHGDLNLRNVLFGRDDDASILTSRPVLIDFSHASDNAIGIYDLCRLEATLRYPSKSTKDSNSLQQTVSFLSQTRQSIKLGAPASFTDKGLQELWRCVRIIRASVMAILGTSNAEAEITYWAALIAEALRLATYESLPQESRTLAFLDAAAIFSKHFQDRAPGERQYILHAHQFYSPPVVHTEEATRVTTATNAPLLLASITRGQTILVIGPDFPRLSGGDPFRIFAQRLYKDVTRTDAPPIGPVLLLEALHKKATRQDIHKGIRDRVKPLTLRDDAVFASAPWSAVLYYHFDSLPYEALIRRREPIRISGKDSAVRQGDAITAGAYPYIPLHGDAESKPDDLVLTGTDRRERAGMLSVVGRALEQKQDALTLLFWRCEELATEELAEFREQLTIDTAVSVDSYFLSDVADGGRDAGLAAVDIISVNDSMEGLVAALPTAPDKQFDTTGAISWHGSAENFFIPNLGRYTRGLVRLYAGSLSPTDAHRTPVSFLLGASATSDDIADGRVVHRRVLDDSLLPAIRSVLADGNRGMRAVVVTGRAGAGVSTLMCHAAHILDRDKVGPIVVADTRLARGMKEWEDAGQLLAEVSLATRSTVLFFAEASDQILPALLRCVRSCVEGGGRLVAILGGRKDALLYMTPTEIRTLHYKPVHVADRLSKVEWLALARVLKKYGFSPDKPATQLAAAMEDVGRLLPALFEATDGKNRRFRDIVAYEYGRYANDAVIQRAYRYICTLGAFNVPLSQYWLLKALGDRGVQEAQRILSALSEDIVVTKEGGNDDAGDVQVSPIHRVIADEVAAVATPDSTDRLRDIERLVLAANMANKSQGTAIASLLYNRGPLVSWITSHLTSTAHANEWIVKLYDGALSNVPIHPDAENHLRQHYALYLLRREQFTEALRHLRRAREIDSENSATLHILGLCFEKRAVSSWRQYAATLSTVPLTRARSDEQEALEFFRTVRDMKPMEEHGYESEARYYRKKLESLNGGEVPSEIHQEAMAHLFHGLWLLRSAEARVSPEELKETPTTRARILRAAGSLDAAIDALRKALLAAQDSVQRVRVMRSLATLMMEKKNWTEAIEFWRRLLQEGERDAALYLSLDDCGREAGASIAERIDAFRDSVEQFNRWDIETQLRWADLSLLRGYFADAIDALRRADDVAKESVSILERDRIRGMVNDGGTRRRFSGRIRRLLRPDEGYIAVTGHSSEVWFRGSGGGDLPKIGDRVTFALGWRIRGLRAVDVEVEFQDRAQSHA